MTRLKTRIRIAPDGTLTGRAAGLPVGEHEAEIRLVENAEASAARDADASKRLPGAPSCVETAIVIGARLDKARMRSIVWSPILESRPSLSPKNKRP